MQRFPLDGTAIITTSPEATLFLAYAGSLQQPLDTRGTAGKAVQAQGSRLDVSSAASLAAASAAAFVGSAPFDLR